MVILTTAKNEHSLKSVEHRSRHYVKLSTMGPQHATSIKIKILKTIKTQTNRTLAPVLFSTNFKKFSYKRIGFFIGQRRVIFLQCEKLLQIFCLLVCFCRDKYRRSLLHLDKILLQVHRKLMRKYRLFSPIRRPALPHRG